MNDSLGKDLLAPLVLRLALATVFLYHGSELVFGPDNALGTAWMNAHAAKENPDAPPPPVAMQVAVAWGEFIGGLAMLVGFLTRAAAVGLSIIMAGAIAVVHGKNGFSLMHGGYEYNFLIIAVCLALVITGGGTLSLDRLMSRKLRAARGGE